MRRFDFSFPTSPNNILSLPFVKICTSLDDATFLRFREVSKSTKEIVDLACLTAPILLSRIAYYSGPSEALSALHCQFVNARECQYWRFYTLAMLNKLQINEFNITGGRKQITLTMDEDSDYMQVFIASLINSLHQIDYGTVEIDRDPKILRSMAELLKGQNIFSVIFRHEATSNYDDLSHDVVFIQSVQPLIIEHNLVWLTKDFMRLLLSHADVVEGIHLDVKHRCESHTILVEMITNILRTKCNWLYYSNSEEPITLADAVKILQIFHRLTKTISFTANTDAERTDVRIGKYRLRIHDIFRRMGQNEIMIKGFDDYFLDDL